ncbi:SNAP25 homologous protein SNAP33-like [Aristolochia californica]|uniref:SNAP25 homologous protein SNAP33-like n=1 Tax=Aristolochia californica TaxID=171875 RepID=UPI0035DC530D
MFRNRQRSADPVVPASNPFDSDPESDHDPRQTAKGSKTYSAPATKKPNPRVTSTGHSDDDASLASSSASAYSARIKRGSRDMGDLESKTTQELEDYAVNKAEDVTKDVKTCLKIAEDIRDEASNTLVSLHQQGEQINRTHMTAADMEHDLSRGEKLLGSLGGMFSKTWKPKKARAITGPKITRDSSFKRRATQADQMERHGLISNQKKRSKSPQKPLEEPSSVLEKVQVEKAKQDDALLDLSNVLDQLKDMAVDMGTEIVRQNKALDYVHDDVEELNSRVKGANQRGRRLLGK